MPATRDQIRRARIVSRTVDFGGGVEVCFWYDRNKITDGWIADWTEQEEKANAPRMNDMLADLLDRWDVLEHEGGPVVPLTVETIGELFSWPDKIQLMKELITGAAPSSEEGNVSETTSSSPNTDSSSMPENHQPTPAPLPSPPLSASPSPT